MRNWIRNIVPAWKRRDEQEYHANMLSLLRGVCSGGLLHQPWYEQNPWAKGLHHGQLYRSLIDPQKGFFRVVLQFDPDDFDRWKRKVQETPRERYIDALLPIPVRWEWMIEELQRRKEGDPWPGIVISRSPLDRETLRNLEWTGQTFEGHLG